MKKIIWLGICLWIAMGGKAQQEGIRFLENCPWNEVLKQAKSADKLIFMDCYTSWCAPCKGLAKDIFPQKIVGDFFNACFINVKYDMEKGDGKMLYEKFKAYIPGFPTLLLINPRREEVVHSMVGYQQAEQLIAGMKAGMEGRTLPALEKKYQAGERDVQLVRDYMAALRGAFRREDMRRVALDYIAAFPVQRLLEKEIWEIAGEYINDPYSEAYHFVVNNLDKYQYMLKVDRAALEAQLSRGMRRAIEEIVKAPLKGTEDSVRLINEQVEKIRELLKKNSLKNTSQWMLKLAIRDAQLQENAEKVVDWLTVGDELLLLGNETLYLKDVYDWLADHTTNEVLLELCLRKTELLQEQENKTSIPYNLYDVLAKLYRKNGEPEKAEEAEHCYQVLQKAQEERFKDFKF